MSSKILDPTGVASEPMRWKRVGPAARDVAMAASPEPDLKPQAAPDRGADEKRLEEAHRRGFVDGEARGRQAAQQQMQAALDRLARSAAEILALKPEVRRETEEDAVKLSLAVARRILRREITVDPGAILGLVKAAMEKLDARDLRRIRVHPDTAALLERRLQDAGLPEKVEILPDPALDPGGAILETVRGMLDASVETQLSEIERGFADLMAGA